MNFENFLSRAIKFTKNVLGRPPMFIATRILGPVFWKRGIVFLTGHHGSIGRIGETAHQFDLYVKMGILGWGPSSQGTLIIHENIANPCLLKYWQRYIRIIHHPILNRFLIYPLISFIQYNTAITKMPDGKVVHGNIAHIAVQKQWENESRPPLLALSSSHHERGWNCLEQLGIPRGSWFVCLHVREAGSFKGENFAHNAYRNADINTYLMAVKTIVENGGWIIRMGNQTTKPLPPMEHVIDYAHSDVRSDWMDIFCCAECRFFLGSTSGLFLVSFNFGVPCALANFTPMKELPWSKKDIFIPKLYWSKTEERYLTFKEALAPGIGDCYDGRFFEESGIKLIDNTQEEINDLVLEMMGRFNGNLEYTEEDEILQEEFRTLLPYKDYGISSRVGMKLLRQHTKLLSHSSDDGCVLL